jgi:hypothetical protein
MDPVRRNRTLTPLFVAALLGITACEAEPEAEVAEVPEVADVQTAPAPAVTPGAAPTAGAAGGGEVITTANFQPGPGAEGKTVGGTARLTAMPGTEDMQIMVQVQGLSAGEHAWHIHSGPCGQKAPVVVPFTPTAEKPGLDEPIRAEAAGMAEQSARIPADQLTRQQLQAGQYSVHAHVRGGVDHGPTVVCADLAVM